jgi:hypothetical protein
MKTLLFTYASLYASSQPLPGLISQNMNRLRRIVDRAERMERKRWVARIDPGAIGRSPISSDSVVLPRRTTLVVYEKKRTSQTEAPARELDVGYTLANQRTQTYSTGNVINSLIRDRSNGFLRVDA